jgi:hypothetical protein
MSCVSYYLFWALVKSANKGWAGAGRRQVSCSAAAVISDGSNLKRPRARSHFSLFFSVTYGPLSPDAVITHTTQYDVFILDFPSMIFSQKRNNFHDEFLNDIER